MDGRGLDFYRVQEGKPLWRRKWQAEWPDCRWAQRGFTRRGVTIAATVRRAHPAIDAGYVRVRTAARWLTGYDDGWYRDRYTWTGKPRTFTPEVSR